MILYFDFELKFRMILNSKKKGKSNIITIAEALETGFSKDYPEVMPVVIQNYESFCNFRTQGD